MVVAASRSDLVERNGGRIVSRITALYWFKAIEGFSRDHWRRKLATREENKS